MYSQINQREVRIKSSMWPGGRQIKVRAPIRSRIAVMVFVWCRNERAITILFGHGASRTENTRCANTAIMPHLHVYCILSHLHRPNHMHTRIHCDCDSRLLAASLFIILFLFRFFVRSVRLFSSHVFNSLGSVYCCWYRLACCFCC